MTHKYHQSKVEETTSRPVLDQKRPFRTGFFVPGYQVAISIDVEQLFSCGHLLLTHVHSSLLLQSTWALLCLRLWSALGLVIKEDVQTVSCLADVIGDDKDERVDILWYKQVWNKQYASFVQVSPQTHG